MKAFPDVLRRLPRSSAGGWAHCLHWGRTRFTTAFADERRVDAVQQLVALPDERFLEERSAA